MEKTQKNHLNNDNLPVWNLRDLFSSPTGDDFISAMKYARDKTTAFVDNFSGKITPTVSAKILHDAIVAYQDLSTLFGKIGTFTFLLFSENRLHTENAAFYQNTRETLQELESDLIFFTLHLCKIADQHLLEIYENNIDVAKFRPWLQQVRVFKPYTLSEDSEKLLHDLHITSRDGWVRLFDQTIAKLQFDYRGQHLSETQVLHIMNTSSDENERRDAGLAFSAGLQSQQDVFALIINNLIKDKATEDRWRKLPSPAASRHLNNQVDENVVEILVQAVRNNYPKLSHRYYRLKARWMGKDTLNFWDRNAPLPQAVQTKYTWAQAQDIVISAYHEFSPKLAKIGKQFFDNDWIHAVPQMGKDSGAYAHPCVPEVHPYILMNFKGSQRDIMTLAHELGHGIHQVLSSSQGYLMSDTPLTIAETASVFGEMLTFRSLLQKISDKNQKRAIIAGKVEDMLNTVVRQIAFHDFETKIHSARVNGEISLNDLSSIWMSVQAESLGSGITLSEPYNIYWAYISHFIHSPFYVYAYAFGDCLVNALYATYQEQPSGFTDKYIAFLTKGGTQRYDLMLQDFNLNPKDPQFWQRGLSVISGLIDELEGLSD